MAPSLIGRAAELRTIQDALRTALDGRASLVLIRGPVGAGKTALIDAAQAEIAGAERRFHVRRASGDVEEQFIEYALVSQLHGQEVPAGVPPHLVANEMLARLREITRERPMAVLVDDAHWCDHSSRRVLRFLMRRISDLPVLMVIGYRPDAGWSDMLHRVGGRLAEARLELGGLDVAGVRDFMHAHGVPVTTRGARRLHDHTDGNPQLLRVLAEELPPEELMSGSGPLPAPQAFTEWVTEAFWSCDDDARAVVAAVAALGTPEPLPVVATVAGIRQAAGAVDRAIERRLLRQVVRDGERLLDTEHALVRLAVVEAMGFAEFHAVHRRAADVVADPVRAMSHRLRAAEHFDESLAAEGMALARRQEELGASLAVARLMELVGELLPTGQERIDAFLRATAQLVGIGELRWAQRLLDAVVAERAGEAEARELLVTGSLLFQRGDRAAREVLERAYAGARGAERIVAANAAELLAFIALDSADPGGATTWASRALDAADATPFVLDCAAMTLASAAGLLGDLAPARSELEARLARHVGSAGTADLRLGLALIDMWSGDFASAESTLAELQRRADDGPAAVRTTVALAQAELDYRLGRWDRAVAVADEVFAFADEGWDRRWAPMGLAVGAHVHAARGDFDAAQALLGQAEAVLEGTGSFPGMVMLALARAQIANARGDAEAVVGILEPLVPSESRFVSLEGVYGLRGELAEALVAVGRPEDAAAVLGEPVATDRDPHSLAVHHRVRGLLAAVDGDLEEASRRFEESLAVASGVAPFAWARTSCAYGSVVRRQGLRRRARELLEAALAGFETLGAAPFAARARDELSRCGARRGEGGTRELTRAEQAVAELVIEGGTNKEIARALSVSVKTVETHLTRIFTKLGVRNRVDLVRRLTSREGTQPDP